MTEPQPATPPPLSWEDLANAVARCGQPVIIVSDRAGKKLAEVSPGAYRRIVPLQVPPERPQVPPDATMALPAAEPYGGFYETGSEDEGPGDAFPGRDESPF